MNRLHMLIGLVATVIVLSGCTATERHRIALDLTPTIGVLAVDINNFRGPVEVRVDSRVTAVEVIGIVRLHDRVKKPRRREMLDAVDVSAHLEEVDGRAVLRVRTTSQRERYEDHDVMLKIRVPRCDGILVHNRGGDVVVVEAGGAVEIINHEGAIEFRTSRIMTDPVTLTTVDGNIYYQVPLGSTGAFDLETKRGVVRYRDRVSSETDPGRMTEMSFQATLARGINPVVARTNQGDINVWIDEDPVALVRSRRTWSPPVADRLFLKSNRRHTRNLPDDHPEVTGQSPRSRVRGIGY